MITKRAMKNTSQIPLLLYQRNFTTTPSVLVFWNTSWFGFGHSCSFTNFSLSIEVKIREITSRYVLDHQPLCIGFLHWFTSRDVLDSYYNNTSWLVIQYITAGDSTYFYFNTEAQHFGLFVVHSTIITVMQLLRSWLTNFAVITQYLTL